MHTNSQIWNMCIEKAKIETLGKGVKFNGRPREITFSI